MALLRALQASGIKALAPAQHAPPRVSYLFGLPLEARGFARDTWSLQAVFRSVVAREGLLEFGI